MWSSVSALLGALIPVFIGCAPGSGRSECPVVRQPAPATPVSSSPAVSMPAPGAVPAAPTPAAVATSPAAAVPSSSAAATPASTASALPELKLHLAGMHIGGGPNDDATKRPFIQAIEGAYEAMRACYKRSEEPSRGGTFGVDLKIAHQGGKPELQQVRTAMKGDGLRECLEGAFRGISFAPPPKGPTVVSVSVKFSLGQ